MSAETADTERTAQTGDDAAEIEELRRRIQALGSDLQHVNGLLQTLLKQRPLLVLGAALAAGYLLGRAVRRS